MREPAFWWRAGGAAARLLTPVAAVYGAIAARRMTRPGAAAGVPVLCVGNLTLGGSGKTPAAIAIARQLIAAGERPFFLSRGYRGRLAGPVRVDVAAHGAADVGDEPLLLARQAPTIVAHDRVAGARLAQAQGATIIVMDDGLQNPSLTKNLALAVVDGSRGIGNGRVFPAGPLRAPAGAQLDLADAMLVVGAPDGAKEIMWHAEARALPIFHGRLQPDEAALAGLRGQRVLAFAGIGNPEKFFATLADAGIDAPVRRAFADHHPLTRDEAAELIARAKRDGLVLVTTEKDVARMSGDAALADLARIARVLPVALVLDDPLGFEAFVRARMKL